MAAALGKKGSANMWPVFGSISSQYLANTTYNGRILVDHFLTTIWPILAQYSMYWPNIGRDLFASNSGECLSFTHNHT
jgi:hypothetical protein